MDHQPLVSVIVPAKDQAPYISDALASLTRQFTDPADLEVLVVDDGSTDGTGELAARFADRLPGLRIIRNDMPTGVANARNRGLRESTGRSIAFLDPDDWYAPHHLSSLATSLAATGVDFVRCDHIRVSGGNRTIHRVPQARRSVPLDPRNDIQPVDRASMVDYCFVWAGLFDRAALEATGMYFLQNTHTAEDRVWTWNLHLNARSYAVVNAPGVFYRRGVATSLTQIYDERQLDFVPCFLEIFRLVASSPEQQRFWPKAARQFYAIACHHLARASRMEPQLRSRLDAAVARGLAAIPPDVRFSSLRDLDPKRRLALLPLTPGGRGRRPGLRSVLTRPVAALAGSRT